MNAKREKTGLLTTHTHPLPRSHHPRQDHSRPYPLEPLSTSLQVPCKLRKQHRIRHPRPQLRHDIAQRDCRVEPVRRAPVRIVFEEEAQHVIGEHGETEGGEGGKEEDV